MYRSSSSDSSDYGERFKNVQRLLIKSNEGQRDLDENYAYKQKLGDLIFDANFEGGNLGFVEKVDQFDYDLMVRPDVTNPRHRIWFNFSVSNQGPRQCVIFNFVNLSENLSLFGEIGLTPVVRSRLDPNWVRLQDNQVFYYRSSNHNNRRILSIAFRFTSHDNEHQFALFYPYTLTALDSFLTNWTVHLKRCELRKAQTSSNEKQQARCHSTIPESQLCSSSRITKIASPTSLRSHSSHGLNLMKLTWPKRDESSLNGGVDFRVQVLTRSALNKPIYELSVSPKAKPDQITQRNCKPCAVIIGRPIGNFESASSFVCQGLLDFMLSDDRVASLARENFDLIVFPMLDPDSIWVGNSRTDLMGQQGVDSKILSANPTLYMNYLLTREHISKVIHDRSSQEVVVIELRVNPNLIGSRVVGSLYANSLRMEKHIHLPRLLSRFSDGFYLEKCEFIDSKHTKKLDLFHDCVMSSKSTEHYRLEISPFGYHRRSLVGDEYEQYDQIKYLLLGKSIAYSLIEFIRPKDKRLPNDVEHHLSSFQPTSHDVDDLVLNYID